MDEEVITNKMLLEHMQAMKNDLSQQIARVDTKVDRVDVKVDRVDTKVDRLEAKVDAGFEDARLHRQALQEDLEETMRVQMKHGQQLSRLHAA